MSPYRDIRIRKQMARFVVNSKHLEVSLDAKASLIQLIFEKPYVQIGQVVQRCGVTRVTAANWLASLEHQGALSSLVSGREKFFINRELVSVLGE